MNATLTNELLSAGAIGMLVTGLLLLVLHLVLWPYQARMHRVVAYTVGTAALLVGQTVALGIVGAWAFVALAWANAGVGGAVIGAAWWVRGLKREPARERAQRVLEEPHAALRGSDDRRN